MKKSIKCNYKCVGEIINCSKKQKGITLIALVITIIVLLILAGVTLSMVVGQNGIFNKANTAKEDTKKIQAVEDIRLKVLEIQTNKNGGASLADVVEKFGKENESKTKYEIEIPGTGIITEYKEENKDTYNNAEKIYVINKEISEGYKVGVNKTLGIAEIGSDTPKVTLASQVNIGDFVNYDAGNWNATVANPTSQGNFGGYTQETSKNQCITPYSTYTNTYSGGWRVLSKTEDTVTIIHAGTPAAYYHAYGYASASVTNLNTFCVNNFINETYAISARSVQNSSTDTNSTIKTTGSYYWFATANGSDRLYNVSSGGSVENGYADGYAFGVRPVVTLKSGIKTTGKANNGYGQQGWTLEL